MQQCLHGYLQEAKRKENRENNYRSYRKNQNLIILTSSKSSSEARYGAMAAGIVIGRLFATLPRLASWGFPGISIAPASAGITTIGSSIIWNKYKQSN